MLEGNLGETIENEGFGADEMKEKKKGNHDRHVYIFWKWCTKCHKKVRNEDLDHWPNGADCCPTCRQKVKSKPNKFREFYIERGGGRFE